MGENARSFAESRDLEEEYIAQSMYEQYVLKQDEPAKRGATAQEIEAELAANCAPFRSFDYESKKDFLRNIERALRACLKASVRSGHIAAVDNVDGKIFVSEKRNANLKVAQRWVGVAELDIELRAAVLGEELKLSKNFLRSSWNVLFLSRASQQTLVRVLVSTKSSFLLSLLAYTALYVVPNSIGTDNALVALDDLATYILETISFTAKDEARSKMIAFLGSFFDRALFAQSKVRILNDIARRSPAPQLVYDAIRSGIYGYTDVGVDEENAEPRRAFIPDLDLVREKRLTAVELKEARAAGIARFEEFNAVRQEYAERRRNYYKNDALGGIAKNAPLLLYLPPPVDQNTIDSLPVDHEATATRLRAGWKIASAQTAARYVTKHYAEGVQPVIIKATNSIPGPGQRGLFAARRIPPHTPIASYVGALVLPKKGDSETEHYDIDAGLHIDLNGEWVNSRLSIRGSPRVLEGLGYVPERDSPGIFTNDVFNLNPPREYNAELRIYHDLEKRELFSYIESGEKEIAAGEEIFVEYGREYWRNANKA